MIKFAAARWAGAAGLVAAGLAAALPVLPAAAATAATPTPVFSAPLSFSCALNNFGITTPVTITGTMDLPTRGTAGEALTVTLITQPVSLPSAVSGQVPELSTITLAAQSPVSKGLLVPPAQQPGGFVHWTGKTGPVSAGAATLPAITAKATLVPIQPGTAYVATTSFIKLTPVGSSGQPVTSAPIECDGPASAVNIPITVKMPPMPKPPPPPKHLPLYLCRVSGDGGKPLTVGFPMRITATGPAEVSTSEHVALTISPPQYVAARMAADSAAGRSPQPILELSAALPVTGAQTGVVEVSGRNGPTTERLSADGSLALTAAGQDTILLPSHFRVTVRLRHHVLPMLSCTVKGGHDLTGATLTVAAGPADSAGTPSGAPSTGGGTGRPGGINRALALGGASTLLGGAGITLGALARRRKQRQAAA